MLNDQQVQEIKADVNCGVSQLTTEINALRQEVNYLKGQDGNFRTHILINLTELKEIDVELDIPEDKTLENHFLCIENAMVTITEKQTEKIFKIIESKLYYEIFAEIEDKYPTEKVRADHLEEELELLKERLMEVV